MITFLEKYSISQLLLAASIILVAFGDIFKIAGIVPLYSVFLFGAVLFELTNKTILSSWSKAEWFAVSWIVFSVITYVLHIDKCNTTVLVSSCINSAFIFTIISSSKDCSYGYKLYLSALAVCILLTIVACFYEVYTGVHFVGFDERYTRMFRGYTSGFQVNVNDNATLLSFMAVALLMLFKFKAKYLLIFLTLALSFNIKSRLCFLALAMFALVSFFLYLFSKIGEDGARKAFKPIFVCLAGIILILFAFSFSYLYEAFISLTGESLATTTADDAFRLLRIEETLGVAINPGFLLGNGPGATLNLIGFSPHAALFELLSDYGFIVFAILLAILAEMFSSYGSKQFELKQSIYLTGFSILFIMLSFCSSSMLRIHCVWVILAIVIASMDQPSGRSQSYEELRN